ncbi:caspase family protein [Streptomyces sp. AC536]|uniref:caspase family protein n=1 Tax=Streptomyces buecherae TaxID=2763006 RepID=UPI00164DF3C7|nr:caspase family protein [Streptomyces buecherae]MBC3984599.1 caspase family protein [Streptomyces buecherae]QNJ39516.1 caspase family protein [Streptomyces buecherae]
MATLHALLVGIDDYPTLVAPPLGGCLNDIAGVCRLLEKRTSVPTLRVLLDQEATVAAVEVGIRDQLGRAGPGDTAMFWFSGHGTRQQAHGADLLVEATGHNQALVCADGLLLDKRLRALLAAVAARGAHVVAIVDCCFAGGTTRDPLLTPRYAPARDVWARTRLPRARDAGPAWSSAPRGRSEVLLLAASRADQAAHEAYFGGHRYGVFTRAVLDVVQDSQPGVSYREVLSAADARVQCSGGLQQPILFPPGPDGVADLPFLADGTARKPGVYLLRHGPAGWEVNCGAGHGLREDAPAGATIAEFAVMAGGPAPTAHPTAEVTHTVDVPAVPGRLLTARTVLPDRALVDPVDWAPAPAHVYPVALTALSLPAATVTVNAASGMAGDVRATLDRALVSAGPGGGPSPLLRPVSDPREAGDLHFHVEIRDLTAHVLRRDGSHFVAPQPLSVPGEARQIADCLIHLTRWHRLRDLAPRPSPLDGLVRVEISPWGSPPERLLAPDGRGEIVCAYTAGDIRLPDAAQPPLLSVRLHNRSPDRALWCLLLDLTDSYASHATLYPGHFIAPGHTGHALDGEPVQFSLPTGRRPVPGAEGRDWLKLIVAECELNTVPFHLPAWAPAPAGSRLPAPGAHDGMLRFSQAPPSLSTRDLNRVGAGRYGQWTTRTIALRTVVPTS